MKIFYADEFKKQFYKIPSRIQKIYYRQENIFIKNWCDLRLHTKKLKSHHLSFSFRITRAYRVLFIFIDNNTVLFATIAHRKDIYR